jgi:hypothetical protein
MRRRPKFKGMTLQQKLNSMTPRSRARLLEGGRKVREKDDLLRRIFDQTYLRNSPVERDEVSIKGGQIRTLPVNACRLEGYNPDCVEHLFEDLVAELHREWEEEGGQSGIKIYHDIKEGTRSKHFAVEAVKRWKEREPRMPFPSWVQYPQQCRACGKWFFCADGHTKMRFCSDPCIAAGERAVVTAYVQSRSVSRERGRRNKCEQCGGPLESSRSSRRYCSGRCRTAAHRGGRKVDLRELGLL